MEPAHTSEPQLAAAPRVVESLQIFVLSRPVFRESALLDFLRDEDQTWRMDPSATDAEKLVEIAGRVCYMSFGDRQSPRSNREYIANLIAQGHESVLEHAVWTFLLTGVSRSFTHQLVRHRVGFAFSQLSQQYHDERDAPVVMPAAVRGDALLAELWERAVSESGHAYAALLDELMRRESVAAAHNEKERLRLIRSAARSVLPANTETKIVVTANARALRHFLAVRGDLTGDEEMRAVTVTLLETLRAEAPAIFEDFLIASAPDGGSLVRHESTPR